MRKSLKQSKAIKNRERQHRRINHSIDHLYWLIDNMPLDTLFMAAPSGVDKVINVVDVVEDVQFPPILNYVKSNNTFYYQHNYRQIGFGSEGLVTSPITEDQSAPSWAGPSSIQDRGNIWREGFYNILNAADGFFNYILRTLGRVGHLHYHSTVDGIDYYQFYFGYRLQHLDYDYHVLDNLGIGEVTYYTGNRDIDPKIVHMLWARPSLPPNNEELLTKDEANGRFYSWTDGAWSPYNEVNPETIMEPGDWLVDNNNETFYIAKGSESNDLFKVLTL